MKILHKVSVKKILTETTKETMVKQLFEEKFQLHKECEQLLFEQKKLERMKKYSSLQLQAQFDKQIATRKEKIKIIDFQLEQIELLPIGAELDDQDVQVMTEIHIGDNWEKKVTNKVIILEDGIVKEIRER